MILTPYSTKTKGVLETNANSAPDHERLRILAMFNNCRGAWSVHTPDSIVLGVTNLLNRKELFISQKESLPALTYGSSQKFFGIFRTVQVRFFFSSMNPETKRQSMELRSPAASRRKKFRAEKSRIKTRPFLIVEALSTRNFNLKERR
ncbi:uncharacterized protein TNCV_1374551 [Trichonephila clavipes]|nr:uncharacterized protein TNCV_1374551 [Trichonephila clavipes]